MTRTFLVAICLLEVLSTVQVATAQVLQPPAPLAEAEQQMVSIAGLVIARKKYSFAVQTDRGTADISVGRGAQFMLKLNKPVVDLEKELISVELAEGSAKGDARSQVRRRSYPLPSPLYAKVQFEHARQMQRIMGKELKHLNRYTLTGTGPNLQMPTEAQLILSGKVKRSLGARNQFELEVGDKHINIVLGHVDGRMDGFSILDLEPNQIYVKVEGKGSAKKLVATEIEFWPVVAK